MSTSTYEGGEFESRVDDFGQLLENVHLQNEECEHYGCAIHSPSDHEFSHMPRYWSNTLKIMVRVGDAGDWYYDPDELAYRERHPDHLYRGGDDDTESIDLPAWEKDRAQTGRGADRKDNLRLPLAG